MKALVRFPFLSSPEGKVKNPFCLNQYLLLMLSSTQNNRQLVFCSAPTESKKELKGYHAQAVLKALGKDSARSERG